jgi:hypothetical protein
MRVSMESNAGELAASLEVAGDRLPLTIRPVVQKASLNIKKDAQERIGRGPYLPMYGRSISYDTEETGTSVTSEIGPDKDRAQGPLGNLLEYGTGDTAPIPHLGPALDAEEPAFLRYLEEAVAKAIEG